MKYFSQDASMKQKDIDIKYKFTNNIKHENVNINLFMHT